MAVLTKKHYIQLRRLLSRLHVHAFLDKLLTMVSRRMPLPLVRYDSVKLSLGFYTFVVLEDVEHYHRFVKPQKGDIVIDAGAHVGIYAVEAAKAVGSEGRVIAIEPDPDNFKMLKFHIALNRLDNVVALRLALRSRIGYTRLLKLGSPHNVISDVATSTLLKTENLVRC